MKRVASSSASRGKDKHQKQAVFIDDDFIKSIFPGNNDDDQDCNRRLNISPIKYSGAPIQMPDWYALESDSSNWQPPNEYCTQSVQHLSNIYRFVSKQSIKDAFEREGLRFSKTFQALGKLMAAVDTKVISDNPILLQNQRPRNMKLKICPILDDEFKWMDLVGIVESTQRAIKTAHERAMVDCECCFDQVEFESVVSCMEGHIFCPGCLKNYAQERLFGIGNTDMHCMDSSGCKAPFPDACLQKVLSQEVYKKFQQKAALAVAMSVLGDSLFSCKLCGIRAEIPEHLKVFDCPDQRCKHRTCILCKDDYHPKFSCEDYKKISKGRVTVEEAMTDAMIRTCPKCNAKFLKTQGCNKVTCSCGAFICYVCKKLIPESYKHFCSTPLCNHKDCNKCILFENTDKRDNQAVAEAERTARETLVRSVHDSAGGSDSI